MTSYALNLNGPAVDQQLSDLLAFINAKFEQVQNITTAPPTSFKLPIVSEELFIEPSELPYEISDTLLWRFEGSANCGADDLATAANVNEEVRRLMGLAYVQAEQLARRPIILWRTLPRVDFEPDLFERKIHIVLRARAYTLGTLK